MRFAKQEDGTFKAGSYSLVDKRTHWAVRYEDTRTSREIARGMSKAEAMQRAAVHSYSSAIVNEKLMWVDSLMESPTLDNINRAIGALEILNALAPSLVADRMTRAWHMHAKLKGG